MVEITFKLYDENNAIHILNALQLIKHFHISHLIQTSMSGRYHYPHFIDKKLRYKDIKCFTQGLSSNKLIA